MLKKLDWDSFHFGYPVYFIHLMDRDLDAKSVINQLLETKFHVCYIESDNYDESFYRKLKFYFPKSIFVSKKVLLELEVQNKSLTYISLSHIQKKIFKDRIIDLCFQSGHHSRFYVDKNFKNGEFTFLYREWAIKSIRSEEKDIIAVLGHNSNQLLGMAIVSKNYNILNIEIIAVDLNCRHLGIGSQLIDMIHTYAFEKKLKQIHVVTQYENKGAYNFYLKNQFEVVKTSFQFHVWNK